MTTASDYALPRVKLEFGARSSGEPSSKLPVRGDLEEILPKLVFPNANAQVINIERIVWEKAPAAHVYCLQTGEGVSDRLSLYFHALARLNEQGYLERAVNANEFANDVAVHKNAFFIKKDSNGERIGYVAAIRGRSDSGS